MVRFCFHRSHASRSLVQACRDREQDGRCVSECRGTHRYNPQTLLKEELPDDEKRYYYERHCVRECPGRMQ